MKGTFPNNLDIDSEYFLEKLKEDDRRVFAVLFDYYYTGLVVFADRYMQDIEMAEDVVQSAFIKLWENRKNIKSNSIRFYLSSLVKNNCIDLIRKEETKEKYLKRQTNTISSFESNFLAESELQKMVDDSISKLPPRCQQIFTMSRFDGLKTIEIAEKLNISHRTVETQISKALKILREDLKDYLFQILFTF